MCFKKPLKVKIFGQIYTIKDLKMIGRGNVEDILLEWVGEDIDYICDCDMVRPYFVYRWTFRNRNNGKLVDIYVVHYTDTDTIAFNGDEETEFIYYRK